MAVNNVSPSRNFAAVAPVLLTWASGLTAIQLDESNARLYLKGHDQNNYILIDDTIGIQCLVSASKAFQIDSVAGVVFQADNNTVYIGYDVQTPLKFGATANLPGVISATGLTFNVNSLGTSYMTISSAGAVVINGSGGALNIVGANTLSINSTQVVGTRKVGWSAWTGTATRTAIATGSATALNCAEAIKALTDDLRSHGLIN